MIRAMISDWQDVTGRYQSRSLFQAPERQFEYEQLIFGRLRSHRLSFGSIKDKDSLSGHYWKCPECGIARLQLFFLQHEEYRTYCWVVMGSLTNIFVVDRIAFTAPSHLMPDFHLSLRKVVVQWNFVYIRHCDAVEWLATKPALCLYQEEEPGRKALKVYITVSKNMPVIKLVYHFALTQEFLKKRAQVFLPGSPEELVLMNMESYSKEEQSTDSLWIWFNQEIEWTTVEVKSFYTNKFKDDRTWIAIQDQNLLATTGSSGGYAVEYTEDVI